MLCKVDQIKLEEKIKTWEQEDPENHFFFSSYPLQRVFLNIVLTQMDMLKHRSFKTYYLHIKQLGIGTWSRMEMKSCFWMPHTRPWDMSYHCSLLWFKPMLIIQYFQCNGWYHATCVSIPDWVLNSNRRWKCDTCNGKKGERYHLH